MRCLARLSGQCFSSHNGSPKPFAYEAKLNQIAPNYCAWCVCVRFSFWVISPPIRSATGMRKKSVNRIAIVMLLSTCALVIVSCACQFMPCHTLPCLWLAYASCLIGKKKIRINGADSHDIRQGNGIPYVVFFFLFSRTSSSFQHEFLFMFAQFSRFALSLITFN